MWRAKRRANDPRVAAVSGKPTRCYICGASICLDLGAAALAYLTELTHRRPQIWIHYVDRLHELLQTRSETTFVPPGGRDAEALNQTGELKFQ